VSSLIALLSSWQLRSLMEHTLTENLSSVRAAEELEISLLEQRGFVSSYLLDGGDRRWLEKLGQRKRGFDRWLARAYETARTAEEREILATLEEVYRSYDAQRDRVVELYDRGEEGEAKAVFLEEVNRLYDRAYELCESFILANERYVDAATTRAHRQVRRVEWAVGVCLTLTVLLGTALLWLFSIQKDVGGDPELDRKFDIVAEETARLERIVRNFLEFSRPPHPKLRVESIGTLLDKTLELVGPRLADRQIVLLRQDDPTLPPVLADVEQLKQVLINLPDNAADAAGRGGEIRVSAAAEVDAEGRRVAVVRIADNGPGMPKEVCERVFEPFFTTKDDGTGLGLCIAAGIVARHGGRLALESSTGRGTTFAVSIPMAPAGEK
jgi:signal transduction histidine kinase